MRERERESETWLTSFPFLLEQPQRFTRLAHPTSQVIHPVFARPGKRRVEFTHARLRPPSISTFTVEASREGCGVRDHPAEGKKRQG